jgi:hypothetical protein
MVFGYNNNEFLYKFADLLVKVNIAYLDKGDLRMCDKQFASNSFH